MKSHFQAWMHMRLRTRDKCVSFITQATKLEGMNTNTYERRVWFPGEAQVEEMREAGEDQRGK